MGYSHWSDDAFQARQDHRRSSGQTAFTYDAWVRATGQTRVHSQMDPFGVTRESRDSAEHPDSLAIGVMFDVTGSMGSVPRTLQTKLGSLMRLLVEKGYVAHPQVLFGAIGDANCDRVPLQVGQFESGLEMDDDLGKIYLEGGGGGQVHESYELAIAFFALHTAIDCFDKRGPPRAWCRSCSGATIISTSSPPTPPMAAATMCRAAGVRCWASVSCCWRRRPPCARPSRWPSG